MAKQNRVFVIHWIVAVADAQPMTVLELAIDAAQLNCYCVSFYCYCNDCAWNSDHELDDGVH